jgi:hypothetical protein
MKNLLTILTILLTVSAVAQDSILTNPELYLMIHESNIDKIMNELVFDSQFDLLLWDKQEASIEFDSLIFRWVSPEPVFTDECITIEDIEEWVEHCKNQTDTIGI